MIKKAFSFFWALGLCLMALSGPRAQEKAPLLPQHRLWLEDVAPILTGIERDVFSALRSDAEREKFIQFFWRTRDPAPDTSENEFREEYMERVRYADRNFGRESSKRGSQTDRGLFHLLLGPPLERHRFATQSEIWPLELWFYKGEQELGLPPYFYLIFFQPQGIGEYRLYSPGVDGPGKLAIRTITDQGRVQTSAVDIIKKISAELASASVSYIPGDDPYSGSLSSDTLIATIRGVPARKYSDAYARSFVAYKDYVETEYLDRYLDSAFQVKVFFEKDQPFLHWSIEPERMNFGKMGPTIYARFELILRMEDQAGQVLFEHTEEIPLELTSEQYREHERQRFAFQDLLPVIPGEHRFLFLLKNKTGKDFSSYETPFVVPGPDQRATSSLLLYHDRESVPEGQKANLKAFAFGGYQYLTNARNEFLPSETLGIFVQVPRFDDSLAESPPYFCDIVSFDSNTSVQTIPLFQEGEQGSVEDLVSLTGSAELSTLNPGYYRVELFAIGPGEEKILERRENFIILSQPYPVVPWVYARMRSPYPGPEHLYTLGAQNFLAGDYSQARDNLDRALEYDRSPATELLLVKTLYGLGLYRESLEGALVLYARTPERETAKAIALNYAALKNWSGALVYLEKLMMDATEISVLNLAAECYLNLGQSEKALPLIQKSLSLLPDQPLIKELEEKARKRRDIQEENSGPQSAV